MFNKKRKKYQGISTIIEEDIKFIDIFNDFSEYERNDLFFKNQNHFLEKILEENLENGNNTKEKDVFKLDLAKEEEQESIETPVFDFTIEKDTSPEYIHDSFFLKRKNKRINSTGKRNIAYPIIESISKGKESLKAPYYKELLDAGFFNIR